MTEKLKSEGECLYCGKMFSQKEIGKHLAEHLTIMEKESAGIGKGSAGIGKESTGKRVSNFVHVEVEAGDMFLHLLIKGDAQMKVIDQFLRDIWLE
jgi:hypothetical protein